MYLEITEEHKAILNILNEWSHQIIAYILSGHVRRVHECVQYMIVQMYEVLPETEQKYVKKQINKGDDKQ